MLRRLHHTQPESFAFTPANLDWARAQMTKYPAGRQASAVIPLLWRAQEQEGWLSRAAIEHVADMLGMPYIRALEVATFYFMFQLQPVGRIAHVQVCGTTSCLICGAEDLIAVCKDLIAPTAHTLSADGNFSWEEVECMGACTNAPMAQIGKDYYEDLTPEGLRALIARFSAGEVPVAGPQNGRYASEPKAGLTSLKDFQSGRAQYNGTVQRAVDIGDTIRRIDGTEVPLTAPWLGRPVTPRGVAEPVMPEPGKGIPPDASGVTVHEAPAASKGVPMSRKEPAGGKVGRRPQPLMAARGGKADDLKLIWGIGPKLEQMCRTLGFYHFDQIAAWTEAEVAWVDDNLEGFKGRVTRDRWVAQAKVLAAGGSAEEAERIGRGEQG